MTKKTKLKLES